MRFYRAEPGTQYDKDMIRRKEIMFLYPTDKAISEFDTHFSDIINTSSSLRPVASDGKWMD